MVYDVFNRDAVDAASKFNEVDERLDKLEEDIEKIKNKNCIYYKKQVKGLYLIVKEGSDCENPETMISRKYIMEKLNMILSDGINFHPVIQNVLDKAEMEGKL